MDLQELSKGNIETITAALPDLSAEQLAELAAIERASARPRSTLIAAIEQAAQNNNPSERTGEAGTFPPSPAGAADRTEDRPAPQWQMPGYTGPLSIEQAEWRLRNIKPAQPARTKSA